LCSPRSRELVRSLGADQITDYVEHGPEDVLRGFDIAMDCAFNTEQRLLDALKINAGASYVSIVSPRLRLIDEHGLARGMQLGDDMFAQRVEVQKSFGRHYHWVFTQLDGSTLRSVARLLDARKIGPLVARTYALDEIVEAHEYCESGQAQGKIVLDHMVR